MVQCLEPMGSDDGTRELESGLLKPPSMDSDMLLEIKVVILGW